MQTWDEGVFDLGDGTIESLVAATRRFDFAVLVLTAIRSVLTAFPFLGEGHCNVWAQLRAQDIRTSKARCLRLMREAGLLASGRARRVLGPRNHDGTITPCSAPLRQGESVRTTRRG